MTDHSVLQDELPDGETRIDDDSTSDDMDDVSDDAVISQAFRWSLVVFVCLAAIGGATAWYVSRPEALVPEKQEEDVAIGVRPSVPTDIVPFLAFRDATKSAGIDFMHVNGAMGQKLLPETMGGGCAFLDYDGDGDADLLFVNSQHWSPAADRNAKPATMALYENDGSAKFKNVTAAVGLDVSFFGMGVAVGDIDNDGDPDLYFTAVGPNHLFRNDGGKFVETTDAAGVAGGKDEWSTSTGWFDYNNDGRLDLFVCNYLEWNAKYDLSQSFTIDGKQRGYGRPKDFTGTYPYLFRNDGDGKFTDVTESAGIRYEDAPRGKSLGVSFADFNSDGNIDIFVANDTVQNFLFHNLGNGTFKECARDCGVAFDLGGEARGGMGTDIGCFRNADRMGIAVGNFTNEMTALYVSQDTGDGESPPMFEDEAIPSSLGPVTRLELSFGVFFFDPDLNGLLDVMSSNGHLEDDINRFQESQHYEQPPQLLYNCGTQYRTEFILAPAERCGTDFAKRIVGRGATFADVDNDGDQDVLISSTGAAPRLLINQQTTGHHWLRVKLTGTTCNRDAIGSWVDVYVGDRILRQQVMPTRSYLSQVELPVTFGLGHDDSVRKVVIRWADGKTFEIANPKVDRLLSVAQGSEQ